MSRERTEAVLLPDCTAFSTPAAAINRKARAPRLHLHGRRFRREVAERLVEVVEHARAQMPLRYLAVRYEDLVRDQEAQVRRMLDFVGIPFDPAHLRPHENRRHAPTASYAQVTEKLYDRSVERWRPYRDQLAPVIPILRPAILRLGYDID